MSGKVCGWKVKFGLPCTLACTSWPSFQSEGNLHALKHVQANGAGIEGVQALGLASEARSVCKFMQSQSQCRQARAVDR